MSHKTKNIFIAFLLLVIVFLSWMLFDLNYGRYCTPIVKEAKYPAMQDRLGKIQSDTSVFELK